MTDPIQTIEGGAGAAAQVSPVPAKPGRKPRFLPTMAASLATFAVLFEFLAFQLNSGNDPALGSVGTPVAATRKATSPPRPVLNRKVIKTKVVHLPPKQAAVSSSAVPVSSGSTASAPAPAAAPAAAPAPAPVAAAPAPAPAAPVTSSS